MARNQFGILKIIVIGTFARCGRVQAVVDPALHQPSFKFGDRDAEENAQAKEWPEQRAVSSFKCNS